MTSHAVYITGTDTDCGKTAISCLLIHLLSQRFERVVGMKPVASGCDLTHGHWQNADALALQAVSTPKPDYRWVNPIALPQPLAPEIAAQRAGQTVTLEPIVAAFAHLRQSANWVVVEGVGGWAAPISEQIDQADLVCQLDIPVILVVGLRLGCINHARLTEHFLQSNRVPCLGWIANCITATMAATVENIAILQRHLTLPYLGCHEWQGKSAHRGTDTANLVTQCLQAYDAWRDQSAAPPPNHHHR